MEKKIDFRRKLQITTSANSNLKLRVRAFLMKYLLNLILEEKKQLSSQEAHIKLLITSKLFTRSHNLIT
jgi:hypothetical protein